MTKEELSKYITATYIYFNVPADYVPLQHHYETHIGAARVLGFDSKVADLDAYEAK